MIPGRRSSERLLPRQPADRGIHSVAVNLPKILRHAGTGVYWAMALGCATSVAIAATVGAFSRPEMPESARVPAAVQPTDVDGTACAAHLGGLYDRLVAAAGQTFTGDGWPTPDVEAEWEAWSETWIADLNIARVRCRLESAESMDPIRRLAERLARLHLAYTTALHSFSDVGRKQLTEVQVQFDALGIRPGTAARDGAP